MIWFVTHGTDWQLSGENGGGPDDERWKGLAKKHTCITQRHRQVWWQPEEKGGWGWLKVGKGVGEMRTSVIVSTTTKNTIWL